MRWRYNSYEALYEALYGPAHHPKRFKASPDRADPVILMKTNNGVTCIGFHLGLRRLLAVSIGHRMNLTAVWCKVDVTLVSLILARRRKATRRQQWWTSWRCQLRCSPSTVVICVSTDHSRLQDSKSDMSAFCLAVGAILVLSRPDTRLESPYRGTNRVLKRCGFKTHI